MRTDFLLNQNGDMQIENGDFLTGESDDQHVDLLLTTNKGINKQHPTLGAELPLEVHGKLDSKVIRDIKLSMAADGYQALKVQVDNGNILIEYVRRS